MSGSLQVWTEKRVEAVLVDQSAGAAAAAAEDMVVPAAAAVVWHKWDSNLADTADTSL